VSYNVTIFPYPTEMAMRCHVIKEFGQYELLNVSVEQRDQITKVFKQYNHDVKVTGNIIMEGFHCNNCGDYKDGEYRVHFTIRGIQKHANGRKRPVWVIRGFEPVDV